MKRTVNKTVNGNAFAVMGVFKRQAKKEGWTQEEINLVLKEAKSRDYDHLLATLENHCEVKTDGQ